MANCNSPIGEAIFRKKAGGHSFYKANNSNFDIEIDTLQNIDYVMIKFY